MTAAQPELVVLLDEAGNAIGTAPKTSVHHANTPLHLAFSAYLFDSAGRLLVTRRALTKATFPGVWTNSVCGHPGAGERLSDAVRRRTADELGMEVRSLRLVLPGFAYEAEQGGVVERELCPVLTGRLDVVPGQLPAVDPSEVADVAWVPWPEFAEDVLGGRREVSVWCRAQVVALSALGADPESWPTGDPRLLPPACPAEPAAWRRAVTSGREPAPPGGSGPWRGTPRG